MKNIAKILIILSIIVISFYYVYHFCMKERAEENISNYIEETSVVQDVENIVEEPVVEEIKEEPKRQINYTAVLEIPSINLKEGVVNNTKNFNSINYAISVDNNSNYPDKMGNFILYAHSGNSSIAFFRNLNKVEINDSVYVYYNGIKYQYVIYDKYDIAKTGKAKVISSNKNNYITLITCNQNKEGYQIVVVGKLLSKENY